MKFGELKNTLKYTLVRAGGVSKFSQPAHVVANRRRLTRHKLGDKIRLFHNSDFHPTTLVCTDWQICDMF
jgi:hypothetical protein